MRPVDRPGLKAPAFVGTPDVAGRAAGVDGDVAAAEDRDGMNGPSYDRFPRVGAPWRAAEMRRIGLGPPCSCQVSRAAS